MDFDATSLVALLVALSGWAGLVFNHITSARKNSIDVLSLQYDSLAETVKALQAENTRLRSCIEELEAETRQLKIENQLLKERIDELEAENSTLKSRKKSGL